MRKLRKVLAIVLTLSLVLSMLNVSAFAASADSSQQIVNQGGTKLYNEAGTEVSGSKIGDNGSVVALSKTISGTDTENYFDITLKVQTLLQQETINVSHDSAVVLTMDMSGTMYNNKMDGSRYVDVAKEKAKDFVNQYADSAKGTTAKRMLAVAVFDTDARVQTNWVDVATSAGKTAALNAISSIKVADNGDASSNQVCTNFDGGVILTKNLFKESAVSSIGKDCSFAIILSDGAPTVTVSGDTSTVGTIQSTFWGNQTNAAGVKYQNARNGGGWTHPAEVERALSYLRNLDAEANVKMIGVGGLMNFKLFNDAVYGTKNGTRTSDVKKKPAAFNNIDALQGYSQTQIMDMTTEQWLTALTNAVGGTYASAANSAAVTNAFNSIMTAIADSTQTTTVQSDAWNVTDPMGSNIEFVKFVSNSKSAASFANNKISWDLKKMSVIPENNVYTYTIKYRVRLMNEANGFVDSKAYDTNGTTSFEYQMKKNDSEFGGKKTGYFPIPQIKGYLQELSFVKKDDAGNPVKGATFTLTHSDGCGVSVAKQTEVSGEDGTVLFENIPSGHSYTLAESAAPDNYVASSAKSTVTVAYDVVTESGDLVQDGNAVVNQALVDISGSKTWNDEADRDGKRPASITINLLANGTEVAEQTVTANDHWEYTFNNVPKYENGVEIVYTITEDEVTGYKTEVKGYDVTNSYEPERISIFGEKTWNDDNDRDGVRAESITIILKANDKEVERKTVTAEDNWKYTFENLYKYEGGAEIDYTIDEVKVDGYEKEVEGYNVINTHKPETTEVYGMKTWNDAGNQDGKRPESIIINLLADGTEIKEQTVTAETQWTYRFTDLPKYRDGGVKIVYSITEDEVTGYETEVKGYDVTNSYVPETTAVSGMKTWDDAGNQDGKRPESIIINLLADGTEVAEQTVTEEDSWAYTFADLPKYRDGGVEIVYSITEDEVTGYETEVKGYNVTNSYVPETTEVYGMKTWDDADDQDGKRPENIIINLLADGTEVAEQTVTAETQWTYRFTDLPKYRDGGVEIVYSITEDEVAGYETEVKGYDVTNTHVPEQIAVSGEKIWNDADNQDGKRPESVTIRLYADGVEVDSKVVTEAESWAYTFENLDKYAKGEEIEYTITEDEVAGYQTVYSEENYNVINVYIPETVAVIGEKTWNDADNQDGVRPESITIRLYADGVEVDIKMVTDADEWTFAFENLPKYRDGGVEIIYTITEDTVEGYEALVDGYNVVNTHEVAKADVSVTKVWNDNNDEQGARPKSIEVRLYANGVGTGLSVELNEENGWYAEFNDLDMYKDGKLVEYNVVEVKVEGYEAAVEAEGYDFTITNTVKVLPPDEPVIEEPEQPVPEEPKEEPQEMPEDENIIDEPEEEQVEDPEEPKQELPEDENIIEDEKAPDTGDHTPISELIVVMLAALVTLFVVKTRKEN